MIIMEHLTKTKKKLNGIDWAYIYEMINLLDYETTNFKYKIKQDMNKSQKDMFDLEVKYDNLNLHELKINYNIAINFEDVKSKKINKLIDRQINKINKQIKTQLLNMINAKNTSEVENLLKTYIKKEKQSQSLVNKIMRIYRTESTLMRSDIKLRIQNELAFYGIKVKRRWVHTLRVAGNVVGDNYQPREDHLYLDGQVENSNGYFRSINGYGTKAPGMFGVASEDINCRCDIEFIL